nr:immunoglobulin heavy chain junction region [Mus musculus]
CAREGGGSYGWFAYW